MQTRNKVQLRNEQLATKARARLVPEAVARPLEQGVAPRRVDNTVRCVEAMTLLARNDNQISLIEVARACATSVKATSIKATSIETTSIKTPSPICSPSGSAPLASGSRAGLRRCSLLRGRCSRGRAP